MARVAWLQDDTEADEELSSSGLLSEQSPQAERNYLSRRWTVPLIAIVVVTTMAALWASSGAAQHGLLRGAFGDSTELDAPRFGVPKYQPEPVIPYEVGNAVGLRLPYAPFETPDQAFAAMDRNMDGSVSADRLRALGIPRDADKVLSREEFDERLAEETNELVMAQGPVATALAQKFQMEQSVNNVEPVTGPPPPMRLRSDGQPGLVQALYTFGAPGTSRTGLYDASRPDGCFPGYRVFSKSARYTVGFGSYFAIADPVSYLCDALQFTHARMEALEASDDNHKDTKIHTCTAEFKLPSIDHFWAVSLHQVYEKTLQKHTSRAHSVAKPALERLTAMAYFAMGTYKIAQKSSLAASDFGWNLVGRSCAWIYQAGGGCKDLVDLYQNPQTLECAVAFEGSDDLLDWFDNMNIAPTSFCGFEGVHKGFRNHLFSMIRGVDFQQNIRSKLAKCAGVSVTGHSLGGAQAELFAACANSGLTEGAKGYDDFRLIAFSRGQPELMPAFFSEQAPGVFLRNKANGLCIDVRGTMETMYQQEIIMFPCETAASDYSKDQRWDVISGGFLQNKGSGLCMEPSADGKSTMQMPCRINEDDPLQKWTFTTEGFLKNTKTEQCVDSKMAMYPCAVTDQKWMLTQEGRMVNKLSGKCLDVKGAPGTTEGSPLLLYDCETDPKTDQLWEFGPRGHLKNKLSGLCAVIRNEQGREAQPNLVLGKCVSSDPFNEMVWEMDQEGFIMHKKRGLCIDVKGRPGINNDDVIIMATCEDKRISTSGVWKMLPGGFIRNTGNDDKVATNQCIGVMGEKDTSNRKLPGAKLFVDSCKLVTDQKWEIAKPHSGLLEAETMDPYNTGFIRNVIGGRKCLDIKHTPSEPSDKLWLQNCEEGQDPARFWDVKWSLTPEGQLKNLLALKCLNIKGRLGVESGAPIILDDCAASQQGWSLTDDSYLVNRASGKCLDVQGEAAVADNSPLTIAECERTLKVGQQTDQLWEITRDGFLRNKLSWKCALPKSGSNEMVLAPCPRSMQRWDMTPEGNIKNRVTGQCIDAVHNATVGAPGWWKLVVWQCDGLRAEQKWEEWDGS